MKKLLALLVLCATPLWADSVQVGAGSRVGGGGGGGGFSGTGTINCIPYFSGTTALGVSDLCNTPTSGLITGPAGTALEFRALLPTAAASTTAGVGAKLTASAATAGTTNAGAAAGGDVTITSGAAARLTSGNANGGNINLTPGAGIGSGATGAVIVTAGDFLTPDGTQALPSHSFTNSFNSGFYLRGAGNIALSAGGVGKFEWNGGTPLLDSSLMYGFAVYSAGVPTTAADSGLARVAASVVKPVGASLAAGWMQQVAGRSRVNSDVTNATNTMANITGLSATLIAGRKYTGELTLKCNNSTAAEGIAVDFDGGNATMTSFAAGAGVLTGGTTVAVTTVSSAIATDFDWSTITGETWITFRITMVVNAAGTFIPRFRESTAHTSGTATVSLGSYMWLEDTP